MSIPTVSDVHMPAIMQGKLTGLTQDQVTKLPKTELLNLHRRAHEQAATHLSDEMIAIHDLLASEIIRRGMNHQSALSKADMWPFILYITHGMRLLLAKSSDSPYWSPPVGKANSTNRESQVQQLLKQLQIVNPNLVGELPPWKGFVPQIIYETPEVNHSPIGEWFGSEDLLDKSVLPSSQAIRSALAIALQAREPVIRTDEMRLLHSGLPDEIVITPEWLSLSGSMVYADNREPRDVDLITRAFDVLPAGARLKFERLFKFLTGKNVHFCPEAEGPSWPSIGLYDLVARRRPLELRTIDEPQFAGMFYKAGLVTTANAIEPGKPIAQYKAGGEFYVGEEDKLWQKWGAKQVEGNQEIVIQPKFDGFRLMVDHSPGKFAIYSDHGLDRSGVFPGLEEVLPKGSYILDCEFMQLGDNHKPVDRWEMAWMGSAKEAPEPMPPVWIAIHDIPYWDENRTQLPYTERLALLSKLLKNGIHAHGYEVTVAESKIVKTEAALKAALKWATASRGSEGAMLKRADFKYQPTRLPEVVKYKRQVEIDARIIGYRRLPAPKPANTHWTRQQALQALPQQLKKSQTYIFRCAIKDGQKWIPLESDARLAPKDIKLDWNETKQVYTGTDDPRLWTMAPGFPERQQGEYKWANTYALKVEDETGLLSSIITVAPMEVRAFQKKDGSTGYSWQHPRAKNLKPKGSSVAQLKEVISAFQVHVEKAIKALNPAFYPDEDQVLKFVLQIHARGQSAHLDLRFQLNDVLEGFTIAAQQPGAIKEPMLNLEQARRAFHQADAWKIDWKTGNIYPRRVQTTIEGKPREITRPGNLRALPKRAEIPQDWLNVQGVTERVEPGDPIPVGATKQFPGVFLIVDKGTYSAGARKSWLYEYFINGKILKGRYLFRLVERTAKQVLPPGQSEAGARSAAYWVFMRPIDQTPYTLSDEAIAKNWLPPKGVSALPKHIRKNIPEELQYWHQEGQKALNSRKQLAKRFEELGGPKLKKEDLPLLKSQPFALLNHTFRGQIVIRFGPSTSMYHLFIGDDEFILDGDPRDGAVAAYKQDRTKPDIESIDGKVYNALQLRTTINIKPGTAWNPTKQTPAQVEPLDWGSAEWIDKSPLTSKLRLDGKGKSFTLFFVQEDTESSFWQVSPSPGPIAKEFAIDVIAKDQDKQLIYGIVLKPDEVDTQGDAITVAEIEEAAHRYLLDSRLYDLQHKRDLGLDEVAPVESYIAPQELILGENGSSKKIPKGAWVLVSHVESPELWQRVKQGEFNAYSIRGWGTRAPQQ